MHDRGRSVLVGEIEWKVANLSIHLSNRLTPHLMLDAVCSFSGVANAKLKHISCLEASQHDKIHSQTKSFTEM